ncbi:Mannose-6-phosphate isomerase 1 [Camellia lanceoleosa]|uniref:Mannose-6-phosphate isomerase 1 n=1 Tax=Camellia lanceoleosa TaxID=1840588 RepID=A0ACC0GAU4_9ERIC|nr:Mannose-6-phosphate isomerase 1 [Camellia lanceoleosa]
MKPSLTLSSGWALTSPNPPLSSKASMIVSIGSDCVGLSLNSWIAKVPGVLCDKVIQKWGVTLPFMFKVLLVSKALSIQAHPDKEFAGFVHKTLPNVFKDDNYKPEMALALTEFEAPCGFISLKADQTGTVVEVLVKDEKPVSVDTKDIVNVARSQSDSDVEVFEAAEAAIEGGYLTGGGFGFSNSNFNVCGSLMCGGCMDNGYTYGS